MTHLFAFTPSTDLSPLIESAFRGLLLACLVAAGLRLLRVHNVVAQKTAWMLVLGCAFAMPLIAPVAMRIPLSPNDVAHLSLRRSVAKTDSPAPVSIAPNDSILPAKTNGGSEEAIDNSLPLAAAAPVEQASANGESFPPVQVRPVPVTRRPILDRMQLLFLLYCAVSTVLLFRIAWGAVLAWRLWRTAEPVDADLDAPFAGNVPVRSSRKIASPLNVGSGILLPPDFARWDAEKLGVVLAHEASHVRQRDFYLQVAAHLYAAIFWFSPLGWWIAHELSVLSEAISDYAGLGESASPASYAQVLLEFAALARPTPIGVAMASKGRLSQRIERLLNESSFHKAFAGTRVRLCAALLVVPVSLFAATALVRVQAAQVPQAPATPPPMAEPPQQPAPASPAKAPAVQPKAPLAAPGTPSIDPAPAPPAALAPAPPAAPSITIELPPPATISQQSGEGAGAGQGQNGKETNSAQRTHNYGAYTHERDGEFYGFFERHGGSPHYTGTWTNGHSDVIEKAQQLAKGDFILYTNREGNSYYIDDPQSIAQMEAIYGQVRGFEAQQRAIERAQQELTRAQARMAERQKQQPVSKADLQKDLADLSTALAKLQARKESTITPQQLSELQRKLGEMQGKLIQLQINQQMLSQIDGQMASRLAELKAQHGAFNWSSTDLSSDAEKAMKSIIDQALKDGKAKPVE